VRACTRTHIVFPGKKATSFLNNKTLVTGLKITVGVLAIASKVASGGVLPSLPSFSFPDQDLTEMVGLLQDQLEETGDQVLNCNRSSSWLHFSFSSESQEGALEVDGAVSVTGARSIFRCCNKRKAVVHQKADDTALRQKKIGVDNIQRLRKLLDMSSAFKGKDNAACCAKLQLFKWIHKDGHCVYIGNDDEATELAKALDYIAFSTSTVGSTYSPPKNNRV
jgi:hypothetical protein